MNLSNPLLIDAINAYKKLYKTSPDVAVYAPGRVNLIGEHVDYNDGVVLPMALPYITIMCGSITNNINSNITSCTMINEPVSFKIDANLSVGKPSWANYVKGTIYQYLKEIPPGFAFNAVITSDVPIGAGLSSSAALEVATATFIETLVGITNISGIDKALRCQKAEHDFANTPCGLMDQYISTLGKKDQFLLIDCKSKEAKLVPFGVGGDLPVVLITNSNIKHQLSGSEYPDRVKQCCKVVQKLQETYPSIGSLRDATMEQLDGIKNSLSPVEYKRGKHVVNEIQRTFDTAEALKIGDFETVGELMNESHTSLKVDYNVSCKELDLLVELSLELNGVYGSRMTGGGFGGCTVSLVDKEVINEVKEYIWKKYYEITGISCDFYEAEPSDGTGVLDISCYINEDEDLHASSDNNNILSSIWLPISVVILTTAIISANILLRKK